MLIFENQVPSSYRTPFIARVKVISKALGINPNWLMAIMYWESARTFSPSITNSIGATGLIQFMPKTAIGLGTTTAALRQMTAVQQLDWVYKYYKPYANKLNNFVDCYLVTFFPAAVGKDENFVMKTSKLSAALIASSNPAFDINKDKQVTVGEVTKVMLSKIPKEWLSEFVKKKE